VHVHFQWRILFIHLLIYLFIYWLIDLFIYLLTYLFIYLFIVSGGTNKLHFWQKK
jgi:hypothetical protein